LRRQCTVVINDHEKVPKTNKISLSLVKDEKDRPHKGGFVDFAEGQNFLVVDPSQSFPVYCSEHCIDFSGFVDFKAKGTEFFFVKMKVFPIL
jgi:hypothetical protein